jgi:hypothetical protein
LGALLERQPRNAKVRGRRLPLPTCNAGVFNFCSATDHFLKSEKADIRVKALEFFGGIERARGSNLDAIF